MGQLCAVEAISVPKDGDVVAEGFLRRMRGGAGSVLVRASDGCAYVVKSIENQQGSCVPFNEALGALLASHIGLPVPVWTPVRVPASLIEQNWIDWTGGTSVLPQPGLYFGSRYLGSGSGTSVYQVIPTEWVKHVSNRLDFVGALVFDLWTENLDRRQALFVCPKGGEKLHTVFIDNGHCFRGPQGNSAPYAAWACLYYLTEMYTGLVTTGNARPWIRWISSLSADTICMMIGEIPAEWKTGIDTDAVVERLIRNREGLHEWIKWANRMLTQKLSKRQQVESNDGSDCGVQLHHPRQQCRC